MVFRNFCQRLRTSWVEVGSTNPNGITTKTYTDHLMGTIQVCNINGGGEHVPSPAPGEYLTLHETVPDKNLSNSFKVMQCQLGSGLEGLQGTTASKTSGEIPGKAQALATSGLIRLNSQVLTGVPARTNSPITGPRRGGSHDTRVDQYQWAPFRM